MHCPNCNFLVPVPNPNQCPSCSHLLLHVPAAMAMPRLVGSFGVTGHGNGHGCNGQHGTNCGCANGLTANQTVNINGQPSQPQQVAQPQPQPQQQPQVAQVQQQTNRTPWWAWLLIALATLGLLSGLTLGIIALAKGATTAEVTKAVSDSTDKTIKEIDKSADVRAKTTHDDIVALGKVMVTEINESGEQTTKDITKVVTDSTDKVTKDLSKVITDDGEKTRKELSDEIKESRKALRWAISTRASKSDLDAAESRMQAAIKGAKVTVKLVDGRK